MKIQIKVESKSGSILYHAVDTSNLPIVMIGENEINIVDAFGSKKLTTQKVNLITISEVKDE